MAYETKDNTGVLFTNVKKSNPTQPDYTGNILINGLRYNLSAWTKISKSEKGYFSIAVSEETQRCNGEAVNHDKLSMVATVLEEAKNRVLPDDDLPF